MAHRPRPKNKGNAKKYNAQMQQWKTEHKAQKVKTQKRLNTAVVNPKNKDDKDQRLTQTANLAKGIKARRERWMQQPAPWGRFDNGQPKDQPSAGEQLKIQKQNNPETETENNTSSKSSSETKTKENKPEPKISERQQRIKKLEELSKTDRNYIPTSMDVESGATGGAKTWKQSQQYKKYQRMLRKLREDEKKGG